MLSPDPGRRFARRDAVRQIIKAASFWQGPADQFAADLNENTGPI